MGSRVMAANAVATSAPRHGRDERDLVAVAELRARPRVFHVDGSDGRCGKAGETGLLLAQPAHQVTHRGTLGQLHLQLILAGEVAVLGEEEGTDAHERGFSVKPSVHRRAETVPQLPCVNAKIAGARWVGSRCSSPQQSRA